MEVESCDVSCSVVVCECPAVSWCGVLVTVLFHSSCSFLLNSSFAFALVVASYLTSHVHSRRPHISRSGEVSGECKVREQATSVGMERWCCVVVPPPSSRTTEGHSKGEGVGRGCEAGAFDEPTKDP